MLDNYGRKKLGRNKDPQKLRYVHVFYSSRALEWLNIRQVLLAMLVHFGLSELVSLELIAFSWSYDKNLATRFYKPSVVFKQFSFVNLFDNTNTCICHSAKRVSRFLDQNTVNECAGYDKPSAHVRSTDLTLIQHPQLRAALKLGLNHIPLQPTLFHIAINVVINAFKQVYEICQLQDFNLDFDNACLFIRQTCLAKLQHAARANKFGFRQSSPALFDIPAVQNELQWLTSNFYISGVDKACNNACFLCIKHIRVQAYLRLMGEDFLPCKDGQSWMLPTTVFDKVKSEILTLLPEVPPPFNSLPFLMATFKVHKQSYRWLTNAFRTIYSNIAVLLTLTTVQILEMVKQWAKKKRDSYRSFLQIDTSLFWIIDSILQFTLNIPTHIHDIYVADITRCYECIPLDGPDNLLDALKFTIKIGFQEAQLLHPKTVTTLWVKLTPEGTPHKARWSSNRPRSDGWFHMPQDRLISLHAWLIQNCFVTLGDRVWKQTKGIPMGFSCSPLWCNLYLLTYEIQFIQRLARLGRTDLLAKFQYAFRYIDDICWLNVTNPYDFLCPKQPRTPENPFWIYPLDILEIKPEVHKYDEHHPTRGISAHFMNAQIDIDPTATGQYVLRKYDKRRALPFPYTQFIKFASNRPVKQAYNVIISQILPILYISNNNEVAIKEIKLLILTMCNNGFQSQRVTHQIVEWLQTSHFPETKIDPIFMAHILSKIFSTSIVTQC